MSSARNVMIRASAGSGKTYALTGRFVRLLANGARPERIVALTFTRKAAGEFFDEILQKLARAAADPTEARKLASDIDCANLGCSDFLRMLRDVIDAMHRLRLGTLDSFFARVARVFPMELGLAGDFEILQEHTARMERQRVLQRMFLQRGERGDEQRDFIEAFKRATFGNDEKRLAPQLDEFLDSYQERYLSAPDEQQWGDPTRIWPSGCEWMEVIQVKMPEAMATFRAWQVATAMEDKQRKRWIDFLAAVESWAPGIPIPRELDYILEKALTAWGQIKGGGAVLIIERKKLEINAAGCSALKVLIQHVVGGEFRRRIETTRGIYAVLRSYDANYHDTVRRMGKLTFGDVQRLLTPESGAVALTGESASGDRLFIDYRLDGGTDHWLLDEFQDTSFGQWSILRNLIDEVVQDSEGGRSFFCVGDVKQAIFAWREGDPKLFGEILQHYNSFAPGTIAEEFLVKSWRSAPPLIDMINAVFGAEGEMAELFPSAAAQWKENWRAHESAVSARVGQAALLHAKDEEARSVLLDALLKEIRPIERGMTCAVLVRDNKTAAVMADYLRAQKLPAVAEADIHVCTDNPVGAALLALARSAAHPGDTLASEFVLMTPLQRILEAEGWNTPEVRTWNLLGMIKAEGFGKWADFWVKKLEPHLRADDFFSRERADQFVTAARKFDETGSRDPDEFGLFMARHTIRDTEADRAIRVMTIHKAKGLGFDLVILPDLEGVSLDTRREGLAVKKKADRSVEWVMDPPNKIFSEHDSELAKQFSIEATETCYEALSLLYVAMTRARYGMYVITKPVGETTSRNYPKLLAETLGEDPKKVSVGELVIEGSWSRGDSSWHSKFAVPAPALKLKAGIALPVNKDLDRSIRHSALRPSGEKRGTLNASHIFSLDNSAGADFGTKVHQLLAEVDWLNSENRSAFETDWKLRGRAGLEAFECLTADALAQVFVRPSGQAEVWRERPFEIVMDGAWVTGVFDRVILFRDEQGRITRAAVFDFKTDRIDAASGVDQIIARYAAQMDLYQRALAVLAGVGRERVSCNLVLTQLRASFPV